MSPTMRWPAPGSLSRHVGWVVRCVCADCARAGESASTCCGKRSTCWLARRLCSGAQALVDYGGALRLAGQHGEAREILRAGMDVAHRCGAAPLADQAEREFRAAGGRPRRRAAVGADSLTASERRVAEMAAEGMSNKDIAQSVFVTLRTVELHLSNAYAKLGIRSRQELAGALSVGGEQSR